LLESGLWIICACVALLPFTWSSLNDIIIHIQNSSNSYEFSMYYLGTYLGATASLSADEPSNRHDLIGDRHRGKKGVPASQQ
jgi:hypothetical protein